MVLILSGNNSVNTYGIKASLIDPDFEEVNEVEVQKLEPMGVPKIPIGIQYASVFKLWDAGYRGQNIKIAVIDSGVYSKHKEFGGNTIHERNKIPDIFNGTNVHGTHVAGTIIANGVKLMGAAPKSTIYDYRIFANENSSYKAQKVSGDIGLLVSSLDQAYNDGCHIINLSLGIPIDLSPIRSAVHKAYNRGVTVISAAGNRLNRRDNVSYPAMYDCVISVGALKINGSSVSKAEFSMDNHAVNIWADGHKVLSTLPDDKYGTLSGTSMASPLVTGVVSAYFSYLLEKGITPSPQKARAFLNQNVIEAKGTKVLKLKAMSLSSTDESEEGDDIEIELFNL